MLISGGGSNLQAVIDAIASGTICNGEIKLVIADRPNCVGLERAKTHGIKSLLLDKKNYGDTEQLNRAIEAELDNVGIDLVVLAGFLSIIDQKLVEKYRNKIVNVHPSLIPSFCGAGYYGQRVHQAAIDYGVRISGATVHFVDEGTDTGKIILQEAVPVLEGDTAKDLAARVLEVEHKLLPLAIKKLCEEACKNQQ